MTTPEFEGGKPERIKEAGMHGQQQQQPEGMQLPPQVKFGVAIMELEDGSVVRMPINPNNMQVTYGMMLRMLMGEIEDVRAEILAIKVKNLLRQPQGGGGLVDLA